MRTVRLSDMVAPCFHRVHVDIKQHRHTHYWLKGGRGSTKSSFISLEIPQLIIRNPDCHAVILRKVGRTIKDSVFPQMQWALDKLDISAYFNVKKSPYEMIYRPTGQRIYFFGVDDPQKIKSIKPPFGYIGIVWFEELDQYAGMNEIRNINQSLMRGGSKYWEFCSFNPPKSQNNWVNEAQLVEDPDRRVSHSTYLDVPPAWLGEQFIIEAEKLKTQRPDLYAHEYMGEVTGTGGDVFANVEDRRMTDEEIENFDNIRNGIDFGFARDPFAFVQLHFDTKRDTVYVFREVYGVRISNEQAYERIKDDVGDKYVYADSAEPKSIAQLQNLGLRCLPVAKGRDSRDFTIKWLSDRAKIYIDKVRCPNTYREFVTYEYEQDKDGNFISQYPKHDDHTIDAVRYALRNDMSGNRFSF